MRYDLRSLRKLPLGLCLVVLTAPVLFGCGDGRPTRVPVSGQVLIDGKPVPYGRIMFVPDDGRPSQAKLDSEGRFTLSCFSESDGAIVGTHKLTIDAAEPLSATRVRWRAPKKFADLNTSGLRQEITGPIDNLAINISWEGESEFEEIVPYEGEVRPAGLKGK